MKKSLRILAILFFGFFILPSISAVQVDIKSGYQQGEIFVAKISGNFLKPILEENIYFYRNVYTKVPFEFDLKKIEEDYFISTQTLGKTAGNYSLVIKNAEYYSVGSQISSEDISANFSITEEVSDFSVNPGVVIAEGPFSIELQNLKNNEIIIYIDKEESETEEGFFSFLFGTGQKGDSYTLKSGEIKKVNLEFQNISNATLKKIKLNTENSSAEIFAYILRKGELIDGGDTGFGQNETEEPEENLTGSESNGTQTPAISQNCKEIGGAICKENEKCSGEQITAKDGVCCLAQCSEKKKSQSGKIIGWSIFAILVLFYVWFYIRKYKRAQKKMDILKFAEEKQKSRRI